MSNFLQAYIPEIYMGLSSLLVHKLRTMLTMLGMIFGVGAVVAMLAITAGVEKEMLSYIDLLGVNNIIIEAKEAVDRNELQARRAISPGMTMRDYRAIKENVAGIDQMTPRKVMPVQAVKADGSTVSFEVVARLDTDVEVDYFLNGGILPYVLRRVVTQE